LFTYVRNVLKIIKVAHIFGLFFHGNGYVFSLTKNGFDYPGQGTNLTLSSQCSDFDSVKLAMTTGFRKGANAETTWVHEDARSIFLKCLHGDMVSEWGMPKVLQISNSTRGILIIEKK
jgi:hypothetical protein